MPRPGVILHTLDTHASEALKNASDAILPIMRHEAPGSLGTEMKSQIRKTLTGAALTVQPVVGKRYKGGPATVVQVAGWVTKGTGLYRKGPGPKKAIISRRGVLGTMTLPGGNRVRVVKGQRPNPFIDRAEDRALPVVRRVLAEGLRDAGRSLQRL